MITELNIKDINNSTLNYLPDVELFQHKTNFKFKPGINIIVGKNGCGKSTLLKLIADYTLCKNSIHSDFNILGEFKAVHYSYLFNDNNELKDGVEVKCDYLGKVFRYLNKADLDNNNVLNSIENLAIKFSKGSAGENILQSMKIFFKTVFSTKDWEFPINSIKQSLEKCNDLWKNRLNNLLQYYKNNQIDILPNEYEYTLLIDEPDRNLDIDNIKDIYNILSYPKKHSQLIAVIHNPILINKLSKLDYINFIELTDNYIKHINKYF